MSGRSFQSIKSELADLDEHYLAELINLGDRQVQEKPPITAATETELIDSEIAEDFLNLARLGLWVVQREQQSRRN
mgnify:CR=1 FL=1|tara:strand:- start:7259 stop:7486 length:228 start_codon:yes stop_codon:yes gene_type:complete